MKYFLRPSKRIGSAALLGLTLGWVAAPPGAASQSSLSHFMQEINPLLSHSQGYLGVLVTDIDNDTATKLRLKDTHGAVITLIDHDAPAGQKGLRVNDVVVSVNGQPVVGAEQFGRMMREIPAGRKVTLAIVRDAAPQTFTLQLVDHKKMEHDVWNQMNDDDAFLPPPPAGMGILSNGGEGWDIGRVSPFGSSLKVGALVEPLTSQMADYLGVQSGIMVKQVSKKSEAANAGLKPHDVIMRVGAESIQTTADWDRALHANAGKMVQVLILRDRKQQILNLQVDSKHHSLMIWTDIPFQQECPEMAALGLDFGKDWAASILEQAQGFKSQFSQEQLDEWQRQAEQMRDAFKNGKFPEFTIDPKAMEEFRKQMEQFRQGFNADQFKMDPKQMEEWKHQMEEFRKSFPQNFHFDRKQLEQFRRQMEQWRELSPGQAA